MVVNDHFTSYIICIQILLMNIMQHSSLEIGRKYDPFGVVFDYLSFLSSRVKYRSHSWHKYKLCITKMNQFLKCFCSPISVSQEYSLLHPRIQFIASKNTLFCLHKVQKQSHFTSLCHIITTTCQYK